MSSSKDESTDEDKQKGKKEPVKKRKTSEEDSSDDDMPHYARRSIRKRTKLACNDIKNEDSDYYDDFSNSDEDPSYFPEKKSVKKDNIVSDECKPFKFKTKLKVAKASNDLPSASKAQVESQEPSNLSSYKPSTSKNSEKLVSGKTPEEIMFGEYCNTFSGEIPATSSYNIKGEYQAGEFVIPNEDLHVIRAPIWKIEGKSLLQKFRPFVDFKHSRILYINASAYSPLKPETLKDTHTAVDVTVFNNDKNKYIVQLKNKKESIIDYRVDLNSDDVAFEPEVKAAVPVQTTVAEIEPKRDVNFIKIKEESLSLKAIRINAKTKLIEKKEKLINCEQTSKSMENSESEGQHDDESSFVNSPLKKNFTIFIQVMVSQAMDGNFISIFDSNKKDADDFFIDGFNAIDKVCEDKKKACLELKRWSVLVQLVAEMFPRISSTQKNWKKCCEMCQVSSMQNIVRFSGLGYSQSLKDDCFKFNENMKKEFLFCQECTDVITTFFHLHHYADKIFQDCKKKVFEVKGSDKMKPSLLFKCMDDKKFIQNEFDYLQELWSICDQFREVSLKSD